MHVDVSAKVIGAALAVTAVLNGCGRSPGGASQTKIRDGAVVQAETSGPEWTATVGLRGDSRTSSYTCSAAVLSDDLLVTAAHCVEPEADLFAYFGTDMRQTTEASQFLRVVRTLVHPDYDAQGEGLEPHDVAVLKLARGVPSTHAPVPVLDPSQPLEKPSVVRLAGFGITEHGNDSDVLRYVDTTYVGTDADERLEIDDADKRGACSGDSGGPLFVEQGGRWFLGGVLSGGPIPCRGVNLYTALALHQDFLKAAVTELDGRDR